MEDKLEDRIYGISRQWILIGAAVVLLLIFAVPALTGNSLFQGQNGNNIAEQNGQDDQVLEDIRDLEGPDQGATVEDIVNDPEQYYGQTVTVSAEIEEKVGTNGFTLGAPGLVGEELLVVSSTGVSVEGQEEDVFPDETVVQVNGTVMEFSDADIESELGIDIDEEIFSDWQGKPVLITSSVTRIDNQN